MRLQVNCEHQDPSPSHNENQVKLKKTVISSQEQTSNINPLKNISLPDPIKSRGRPRGKNLTAIGLPAKRKRANK
ncbi:hypothetical protein ABEB36_000516 [Hypothenemus hampei]|uniref:Uncharacterized protein n=1 Tax=Hypothenemus hampei TaxID=57062 RepID=A0ABD1FBH1_HYPHA